MHVGQSRSVMLVMAMRGVLAAITAMEGHQKLTPGIERCHARGGERQDERIACHAGMREIRGVDNGVL